MNYKIKSEYIEMIEIEIFSYCNRKCWFCPNSFIDRNSSNILMEEKLYLKILNELSKIKYSNIISYSRYNEPTSNSEIFIKRLNQAKSILPYSKLHTNTNGDYLTREYLDNLYEAGLISINIQTYLKEDEVFDLDNIKIRVEKMANKLKLEYDVIINRPDFYKVKFDYKDMELYMQGRDFKANGNNRGNSLNIVHNIKRKKPCYIPFSNIYIDYTGDVMLCCNLRSDIEEHKKFILGNCNNENILNIFNSKKIRELRKILDNDNIKILPCCECNFLENYIPKFMKNNNRKSFINLIKNILKK